MFFHEEKLHKILRSVKKSTYSFLLIVTVLFSGSHTAKGTVHFHVCTALLRSRVVYLSSGAVIIVEATPMRRKQGEAGGV